jgi:hypothetical protein
MLAALVADEVVGVGGMAHHVTDGDHYGIPGRGAGCRYARGSK